MAMLLEFWHSSNSFRMCWKSRHSNVLIDYLLRYTSSTSAPTYVCMYIYTCTLCIHNHQVLKLINWSESHCCQCLPSSGLPVNWHLCQDVPAQVSEGWSLHTSIYNYAHTWINKLAAMITSLWPELVFICCSKSRNVEKQTTPKIWFIFLNFKRWAHWISVQRVWFLCRGKHLQPHKVTYIYSSGWRAELI